MSGLIITHALALVFGLGSSPALEGTTPPIQDYRGAHGDRTPASADDVLVYLNKLCRGRISTSSGAQRTRNEKVCGVNAVHRKALEADLSRALERPVVLDISNAS